MEVLVRLRNEGGLWGLQLCCQVWNSLYLLVEIVFLQYFKQQLKNLLWVEFDKCVSELSEELGAILLFVNRFYVVKGCKTLL